MCVRGIMAKKSGRTWHTWRDVEKTEETQKERGRLETQWVSSNHSSVLHDRCRDGPHVAEELSGLAGVERLDLVRDPVVSLGDGERRVMVSNWSWWHQNTTEVKYGLISSAKESLCFYSQCHSVCKQDRSKHWILIKLCRSVAQGRANAPLDLGLHPPRCPKSTQWPISHILTKSITT